MRQTLTMNLSPQKYTITIETGAFLRIGETLSGLYPGKKIAVITDEDTKEIYGDMLKEQMDQAGIPWCLIVRPAGDVCKNFENLPEVYSQLSRFQLSREDILLSFGGGAVNDLAGFVAATYQRGVDLIKVPTTLIAQVDAAIGGKCSINLPEGKNMAGAYYQPKAIIIDPGFARTLPDPILADGMAEIIKTACVCDPDLYTDLLARADMRNAAGLESIIYRCCLIKKQALEQDSWDKGAALLLNFGHTLGHAIENCYPDGRFRHGHAVAIGMHAITSSSERLGLTAEGTADKIKKILLAYDLDYAMPKELTKEQLVKAAEHDKKHHGEILDLVILSRIGEARIHTIQYEDLYEFIPD